MMTHRFDHHLLTALALVLVLGTAALAEEGMYPMSELGTLDLQAVGLAVDQAAIYNPDGLALVDGICKLGGCTGSFVSDQGLILTNHHCAYGAVRNACTEEHDYLAEGFSAANGAAEFPAVGHTVRITDSYRDVSDEVLGAVKDGMTPLERTRAIDKKMKEISLAEEERNPGKRAEVSEMFLGKNYVLFIYTYLKDVRLVYAPPEDLAKFGGEADNWIWPRHSGDFAFMRAYVGPDGSPAEYAPDNVPYQPKKVLRVSAAGVAEEDPVFILGYPGSTYRHRPAAFVSYLTDVHMPYIVDWYGWQIELFEQLSRTGPEHRLALASRLRSLHNTHKNYRGKLQGIERLDLIAQKRAEEDRLNEFIAADAGRAELYGDVLDGLDAYYRERTANAPGELWLRYMLRSPEIMSAALTVWENGQEKTKPETEREQAYMDRNLDQTVNRLKNLAKRYDAEADCRIMAELLLRADEGNPAVVGDLVGLTGNEGAPAAGNYLEGMFADTDLMNEEYLVQAMEMSAAQLQELQDPFINLAAVLYEPWVAQREEGKRRKGNLDPLQAALVDVRRDYLGADFVPDANGTLRFTFGLIEGYTPRDAVWLTPLTTVRGLLEKDTGRHPFALPAAVRDSVTAGDFGPFASEELDGVPVNILYSTDTTGGNSGSPVFNAAGEVVGLNFDRAWEATINDFAWDHSYSRSIGVDIRYVLWVTWKIGGADRLLAEMGVAP
ncbi:MAG: S46 family peptidase [Candidatus Krumholzibacteriota bacterium]